MNIGKMMTAVPKPSRVLGVSWDDGFAADLDLTNLIEGRAVLAPLRDEGQFKLVQLSSDGWSVEWPCGIDFGASQLRRWAVHGFGEQAAA